MSFVELVPMVRSLPRVDKQRMADLLANDLANDDESGLLDLISHSEQVVWSPYDANEAAAILLELLRSEEAAK